MAKTKGKPAKKAPAAMTKFLVTLPTKCHEAVRELAHKRRTSMQREYNDIIAAFLINKKLLK